MAKLRKQRIEGRWPNHKFETVSD